MSNLSFNPNETWAFLIGNWEFEENSQLPNLPSVEKNIESLAGVLSDPLILGIPKEQIISLKNQLDILQTFIAKFPKPVETLIVYYAGHGLCGGTNLFLALPNSLYEDADTGLEFEKLWKKILNKSRNIILILDCCYSGKAFNAINKQDGRNIVVLTATDKTNLASSPKNWQNTAFTQHFIELLKKGIRNHQPFLTLKEISNVLKESLSQQGFPKPSENEFLDISPFYCFHNLGFKTFYVPRAKNEYFTGREEILKQLHDKLQQNQAVALNQKAPTIAVHGLGGIGKTQTLIEYAYRCRDKGIYQTILWLSADSKESFESGFQTLATELGFSVEGKPSDEIIKSVENWFLTHRDWLLLIDNADELEIIRIFLSKVKGYGQILISTRKQSTRSFAEPLALEEMTELEALEFLEKRTGLSIDHHAEKLAKTLGYLPLALDQAAAYISATQMSFDEYLDIYQSDSESLLNERGELLEEIDHPIPVTKTWLISFEKVQEKSELAITILKQCAFLSPDGIVEEIFNDISKKDFNDALKEILKYSLLTRDAQRHLLFMHRLVQEVLRAQLSKTEHIDITTHTVELVVNACPNDETDFTAWLKRRNEWLLNAREIKQWIQTFQLQSAGIGILLSQMGYFLNAKGEYEKALPLLEESLKIIKEVLGTQHPDYASSLNNLAELYRAMGDYEKALPLFEESLKIDEKVYGRNYPEVATDLNNLAALYRAMGDYKKALPLFEESLKIDEKVYGRNHPEVATDLNNLAALYDSMGDYEKALPLYEESLKIRKEVLGNQHPDYAISVWWLATYYQKMENYEKALPLYEEAVGIFTKVLGEQHPNTKTVKENYESCLEVANNTENYENLTGLSKPVRFERKATKISRNDPCSCGSGKKYKHCCGKLS